MMPLGCLDVPASSQKPGEAWGGLNVGRGLGQPGSRRPGEAWGRPERLGEVPEGLGRPGEALDQLGYSSLNGPSLTLQVG
jgi:hypothetical protein